MAGRITISTLNDDTGVLATQNGMSGIAKAWASWTGSTGAIRASFNVSSVTRNGAGDYTVNFTTAMADANYSVSSSATTDGGNQSASLQTFPSGTAPTSSAVRVKYYNSTVGQVDPTFGYVAIFR